MELVIIIICTVIGHYVAKPAITIRRQTQGRAPLRELKRLGAISRRDAKRLDARRAVSA